MCLFGLVKLRQDVLNMQGPTERFPHNMWVVLKIRGSFSAALAVRHFVFQVS